MLRWLCSRVPSLSVWKRAVNTRASLGLLSGGSSLSAAILAKWSLARASYYSEGDVFFFTSGFLPLLSGEVGFLSLPRCAVTRANFGPLGGRGLLCLYFGQLEQITGLTSRANVVCIWVFASIRHGFLGFCVEIATLDLCTCKGYTFGYCWSTIARCTTGFVRTCVVGATG